jgi:hypothetical protein
LPASSSGPGALVDSSVVSVAVNTMRAHGGGVDRGAARDQGVGGKKGLLIALRCSQPHDPSA